MRGASLNDGESRNNIPGEDDNGGALIANENVPVKQARKSAAVELFEWLEIFAFCLATVVIAFTFALRMVTVDGPSMRHTLEDKDRLIISNLFYKPTAGDIVVFQLPGEDGPPLIKRVIATEGQQIMIDFNAWEVYVDGEKIDSSYVNFEFPNSMDRGYSNIEYPRTVAAGRVFVMGDNRNHSKDSRIFGEVDQRYILGRVLIRLFPLKDFGLVNK